MNPYEAIKCERQITLYKKELNRRSCSNEPPRDKGFVNLASKIHEGKVP